MLDELLGRAELKDQLAQIEGERDRLERRLDAETERRRDAVRERQSAEERINHLEDRIAGLEGELAGLRNDESGPSYRGVVTLGEERAAEIVDRLASVRTAREGALTAGVDETAPDALRELLGERSALIDRAAPCVVCADDAGLVQVALAPPRYPGQFETWDDRFALERAWFVPSDSFTFALVRADRFAVGTYVDGELTDIEVVESEVMGRHSKGGFSQARFDRRRDEQIEAHLERCRAVLDARATDPVVLVGDRRMLSKLDERATATATVDASGPPREALTSAFRDFWRTRMYLL